MKRNFLQNIYAETLFLFLFLSLYVIVLPSSIYGQKQKVNYDENAVPAYILPDPLILNNGAAVRDAQTWRDIRREEILEMFEKEMFGKTPEIKLPVSFELTSLDKNALGGKATRKEITAYFTSDKKGPSMVILMYLPNQGNKKVPVFLAMNFHGIHTIHSDPGISITKNWLEINNNSGIDNDLIKRGSASSRWPVEKIIGRGYALATIYYEDLDPDFDDGFKNGIHPLFCSDMKISMTADAWGSIGAWAWGYSRAMDYLETDKDIDSRRVVLMGHSRLGKAALWAGAQDQRFAVVISNNSGCGGAALSKRAFGETVESINTTFPHWFCGNFKKYNSNEASMPFDQHMLLSLIAPRPLYVASALEDEWADPEGEFLGALNASPVYKLLGTDGMKADVRPPLSQPVMSTIGYHIRPGKHDVTDYDWDCYMNFADKHLSTKNQEK